MRRVEAYLRRITPAPQPAPTRARRGWGGWLRRGSPKRPPNDMRTIDRAPIAPRTWRIHSQESHASDSSADALVHLVGTPTRLGLEAFQCQYAVGC